MFEVDRISAVIKPTVKMLEWLNNCPAQQEHLTLQNLRRDCIVLLIPEFDGPKQAGEYVKGIFEPIFEAELISWGIPENIGLKIAMLNSLNLGLTWNFTQCSMM